MNPNDFSFQQNKPSDQSLTDYQKIKMKRNQALQQYNDYLNEKQEQKKQQDQIQQLQQNQMQKLKQKKAPSNKLISQSKQQQPFQQLFQQPPQQQQQQSEPQQQQQYQPIENLSFGPKVSQNNPKLQSQSDQQKPQVQKVDNSQFQQKMLRLANKVHQHSLDQIQQLALKYSQLNKIQTVIDMFVTKTRSDTIIRLKANNQMATKRIKCQKQLKQLLERSSKDKQNKQKQELMKCIEQLQKYIKKKRWDQLLKKSRQLADSLQKAIKHYKKRNLNTLNTNCDYLEQIDQKIKYFEKKRARKHKSQIMKILKLNRNREIEKQGLNEKARKNRRMREAGLKKKIMKWLKEYVDRKKSRVDKLMQFRKLKMTIYFSKLYKHFFQMKNKKNSEYKCQLFRQNMNHLLLKKMMTKLYKNYLINKKWHDLVLNQFMLSRKKKYFNELQLFSYNRRIKKQMILHYKQTILRRWRKVIKQQQIKNRQKVLLFFYQNNIYKSFQKLKNNSQNRKQQQKVVDRLGKDRNKKLLDKCFRQLKNNKKNRINFDNYQQYVPLSIRIINKKQIHPKNRNQLIETQNINIRI